MSDLFENLSNASNGKELVDLINSLGLDAIAAELSGAEAAAIVEKFSADSDFNKFVGEVAANAAPVQAAPVPEASPVPVPDNALDFSRMVNAANGAELVGLFGNGDLATITAGLSPEQIEQVVQKFGADNDFNAWLTTVAPPPPPAEPGEFVPPPMPGSGLDFSRMVNAANGAELVGLFGNGDLATITAGLSPEQIEQVVQKFGADNDFNAWLTTVAPPPPPAEPGEFVPPPLPTGAELDELVDRAQNSGQGPLITDSKGQILNQYGEIMVLDSSGNLAPAPRDVPVGMLPDGNGSFMPDPDWMPPSMPGAYVPPPLPSGGELDDLVDKAQNSGQGPLNKDASGQLVNQYGEIMVLDSSGNLAPAPRDVPVGMLPDGDGSFMPDPGWMPPNPPPDYVPPGGEWIPPPGEEYFEPLEPPPEEGYFEPEGSDDNVEIVGQYSEPPLAHQNGA